MRSSFTPSAGSKAGQSHLIGEFQIVVNPVVLGNGRTMFDGTIIAQAASKHGIDPRSISFKGAIQTLEAFQPVIALQGQHDAGFCGPQQTGFNHCGLLRRFGNYAPRHERIERRGRRDAPMYLGDKQ
jgi:hypothetical protein